MRIAFLIAVLALVPEASAQRSVREYTAAQRASLQEYLSAHPDDGFIPETWFDEETLRYARDEWGFGRAFKPYYQRADFSEDGRMDFAVVLLNGRTNTLRIVVFDQVAGDTYRVAHIEDLGEFHDAAFISRTGRRLVYGVMETDECGTFVPAGRGYLVEACP